MTVVIDFETCDSRGASFEYFREDFRVFSLSCAHRDRSGKIVQSFFTSPTDIQNKLTMLSYSKAPIVAHNLPYEMGVVSSCYPNIKLNWYADTMRLSQIRDGGGDEFNPPELTIEQAIAYELGEITDKEASKLRYSGVGLSLEACAKRFLEDVAQHDHKKVAHDWLTEHHNIKKNFGGNLHLLPRDILEQYNNADTLVTLLLYENLVAWCSSNSVDWAPDHKLYLMRAGLITGAYRRGILIDTGALYNYIIDIEAELNDIEQKFKAMFVAELEQVAELRLNRLGQTWATSPTLKTDVSRFNRWLRIINGSKDKLWKHFNIGSSQQLAILFKEILGITPKFFTKKGGPSFKTTHLHQWGPGGDILQQRKKRLLVLQQVINTYIAALYDGRVHCSVRVSGTRTNRVAGGRI